MCGPHSKETREVIEGPEKMTQVTKPDGTVVKLKWSGKGRLTDGNIDKLQVFYGGAIRNNPGNVDAMYRAVWAVFYHCSSTDTEFNQQ